MARATQQHRLGFDDPDSLTRDAPLSIVRAYGSGVEPFDMNLFTGFTSMKALTYTASIRMIVGLLRDYEYDDFECVFGHEGILRPDLSDVLAFQTAVDEQLSKAFVGVQTSDERRQALFDLVATDRARFFVVKDKIAHAKIYLLERDDLRRVVVGSSRPREHGPYRTIWSSSGQDRWGRPAHATRYPTGFSTTPRRSQVRSA